MGRYQQLRDLLTGMMGQHPSRVSAFLDTLDDASAARLMEAAESDDTLPILKAMSEQTWGTAPARQAAPSPEPTGIRGPMSFEDRILRDPEIRRSIEAAGGQVPAGGPDAILDAYRGTFTPGKRGRPKSAADAIRELAKPADQVAAESIAGQFDRALIPYGTRGPGVPGGLSGPGVTVDAGTELIVAPPRRIGGETRALAVAPDAPRPFRVVDEAAPPRKFPKGKAAAAFAGGAAGLGMMMRGRMGDDTPAVASGGEADLAGESRPAPSVTTPDDYSLQARELINKLNAMRRAAGGEVPEAPAMMREINRLVALGNAQRKAPGYSYPKADPARDPYQQARNLIAQVNNMYRAGYQPGSPEVERIMAEVRRLQAQGDAIRNRRAG